VHCATVVHYSVDIEFSHVRICDSSDCSYCDYDVIMTLFVEIFAVVN